MIDNHPTSRCRKCNKLFYIEELCDNMCVLCGGTPNIPRIVCLCGSTRFKDEFIQANKDETLKGNIVLTVGLFGHHEPNFDMSSDMKLMLDELHKRKIDLANEILVINVNHYIGNSTKSEIEYAQSKGKVVRYLWN